MIEDADIGLRGEPDPSFWKGKTVLVTGSGGFAGGYLTKSLHELGARVRCFLRPGEKPPLEGSGISNVLGDVEDYGNVLAAFQGADLGFHLAAVTSVPEARQNIFRTFSTNTLGTLNFLMAAKENKTSKLVYVSTCQVYGEQDRLPITEDALPHPIDIYSASKLSGENLAISFAETSNIDVSISRAFNHYGPRQRPDFLIPLVISRLLKNQPLRLRSPRSTRDFSYVEDIVRGYLLLAERGEPGQVYQFCSGTERSVRSIVETISRIIGTNPEIRHDSNPLTLDVSRSVGDYSKSKKALGWRPRVTFDEGLRKTISWYKNHPEIKGLGDRIS